MDDGKCPTCRKPGFVKPDAVITVRLNSDLHEKAKTRARLIGVSLNRLCVAALERELTVSRHAYQQRNERRDP